MAEDRHQTRADKARRDLDRVSQEGEIVGTSAFVRAAHSVRDHMSGADAPEDDAMELWGRRIGRGLAVIFAIFLVWWLAANYL